HAGPEQLKRNADVDLRWAVVLVIDVDHHAQVARLRLLSPLGGGCGPAVSQRVDEAVCLVSADLAGGEHLQDQACVLGHASISSWRIASSVSISPRLSRPRISARDGRGLVSTKSRLPALRLSRALVACVVTPTT